MNQGELMQNENRRGALFAYICYLLTIFVIAWGAFVRATHSGAGCGKHWPMCNGEVLPFTSSIETLIEFTHRTTSGLSAILVFCLWWWIGRRTNNTLLKKVTISALAFMGVEVMIGASLVLFGWVKDDTSGIRAVVIALHLLNSFLLLASLNAATMLTQSGRLLNQLNLNKEQLILVSLFLLTGSFGAVTALGDTLFPVTSFAAGISQDFSFDSHFLLQLRILHPLIAVISSYYLIRYAAQRLEIVPFRRCATGLLLAVCGQIVMGLAAIVFLAPIYLQLLHLAGAMLVWHFLVQIILLQRNAPIPSNQG